MSIWKQLSIAFAAGTMLFAANAFGQSDSEVIARVGNISITRADLAKEESNRLLQARYQYYQAEIKALDDLVSQKLLEVKAHSENITVDQLIARDIKPQVKDPTDDQMKVYYEGLETDQPYEAVREKILEKIRQLRFDKAKAAYVKTLNDQINVIVELTPPNADVELANANIRGPKNPTVTLVEFADYECPYCQKVAAEINQLQTDMGDKLAIAYKDFPLPMHSHSEKAAEAARCAGKQGKFWEYHDLLFHSKQLDPDQLKEHAQALKLDTAQFDKCLDSGEEAAAVQKDRAEGQRLGLSGTPSFFVNGHFFSGAFDYKALRQIVEQQLADSSRQVAMNTSK
jgi:protein-disulfide isomerase